MDENEITTNEEDVPSQTKEESAVSTPNQNPELLEQNNHKRNIILVVLALIILSGIVWAADRYLPLRDNEPTACTTEAKLCSDGSAVGRTGPNCEFAECPAIEDISTDWKTYRNEEYGFEFEYPSDWIGTESPHATASLRLEFGEQGDALGAVKLEIWFLDEEIDDPSTVIHSEKELIISNSQGDSLYKTIYSSDTSNLLMVYLDINTGAEEEGWGRYFYDPTNESEVGYYQHILSTFKFIEPINTSTWKTYRNEEYDYSLKYPPDWYFFTSAIAPGEGEHSNLMSFGVRPPAIKTHETFETYQVSVHNADVWSKEEIISSLGAYDEQYEELREYYGEKKIDRTDIVVGSMHAIKVEASYPYNKAAGAMWKAIIFEKDSQVYSITNVWPDKFDNFEKFSSTFLITSEK